MALPGQLGDDHELSRLARRYAADVVEGDQYPLTSNHVDLSAVTFETSRRMQRRHASCVSSDATHECVIRLSEKTHNRAGFGAIKETLRHELVHVYQVQTDRLELGHGSSFKQWIDALELAGRCSDHYDPAPGDFKYRLYCSDDCGFLGGRYRWSIVVKRAIRGLQRCSDCDADIRVEGPEGVLDTVPPERR